ncbi:DUF1398 family protein [Pseudocitrobacter faecalis]|uniref:DUF1398 family protein n=1 Tax=Pseudocitrobacter faecalis TaxID=1398493 RepID=UPI003899C132
MELHDEISGFFAQVRDNLDFVALTAALQRNNISHYIYFVATGNIKLITHADSYISLRCHRRLVKVNSRSCPELTRLAANRIFSGKSNYEQFYNELAQAGVFKWVVDLNNQTRFYWSKDNTLLHSENIITPIKEIEMAI